MAENRKNKILYVAMITFSI